MVCARDIPHTTHLAGCSYGVVVTPLAVPSAFAGLNSANTVPKSLIDNFDKAFDIRKRLKNTEGLFWKISRSTAYRLVKRVMNRADITGKKATAQGLRLSRIISVVESQPSSFPFSSYLMGHITPSMTLYYLQKMEHLERLDRTQKKSR